MSIREKEVLNMQLVLIPILANAWKKTYSELSDLLKKYDVLSYIDVCYEAYNSTGNQGIIDDLQDYIEMQGGFFLERRKQSRHDKVIRQVIE